MHAQAQRLVSQLLESGPSEEPDYAYDLYQRALDEHPDWWAGYSQATDDAVEWADRIADKIYGAYRVKQGGDFAQDIYKHVLAGLT